LVTPATSCRLGSVDMENVIKSLKDAEESAAEVEKQTTQKSSELVKEAEEKVRQMEGEIEGTVKKWGERHISNKLGNAKAQAVKIRGKAEAEGEEMERKAKGKMSLGVDQVADAVIKSMRSGA